MGGLSYANRRNTVFVKSPTPDLVDKDVVEEKVRSPSVARARGKFDDKGDLIELSDFADES